eukprot:scaffold87814_cov35-Tisochrysis_lutea.AAC.1
MEGEGETGRDRRKRQSAIWLRQHKRADRFPDPTRAGKHRKHPGGRGNAGGQHHHRIMFDK